jgi:hypothetical protein
MTVNHTYLYPLPASARFLWRLARTNVSDLFGHPADDHMAGWLTAVRLDETFGRARRTVMRLIKDAPRVCIGEGYVIPGSLTEDGGKHHAVHENTAILTRRLWDGEVVTDRLYGFLMDYVQHRPDIPGRDSVAEISAFLRVRQHEGEMIIPVRM